MSQSLVRCPVWNTIFWGWGLESLDSLYNVYKLLVYDVGYDIQYFLSSYSKPFSQSCRLQMNRERLSYHVPSCG